jgi:hypothetical protein
MRVPIEIRVIRFVCPYCHRGHSKRASAESHIARCFANAAVHACRTCEHYCKASGHGEEYEAAGCAEGHSDSLPKGCEEWQEKKVEK